MFFHQTIVRRRAPMTTDAHGQPLRDWDAAVDTPIADVNVQPNAQEEDSNALRTSIVTSWRIQSAPGVDLDIVATDRVVHEDVVCEVVGEVARWPHPLTGDVHHVELTIRRWEG